jgi:hypothetical protein
MMQTKDRITIVISVLSLVAGTGWGTLWLERRHQSRSAEKAILNGFLMPLQSILNENKRVHSALTQDPVLSRLEYAPDYLQQHFMSFPESDPLRLTWSTMIEGLIDDNRRAVVLIQDNAGNTLRGDFRRACGDFVHHAKMWEALWRAALGESAVQDSLLGSGRLLTPAFPESMDVFLAWEIEERRQRAGM